MFFRVVCTCNRGEENGPGTENKVEILAPMRETAEPDLPTADERGRSGGGGEGGWGLLIATDLNWEAEESFVLALKSLFFKKRAASPFLFKLTHASSSTITTDLFTGNPNTL